MTTITDTEVKQKGLGALLEALGEVDAERFITLLNRDPFDYTTWQKSIFENIDVRALSAKAMDFRNKKS
jgi:hypothetical protein